MGYNWRAGDVLKSKVNQVAKELESDAVTVEFLCKSCGKKFKIQLYPKWKSDARTDEEMELELNVKCPKCKSSEVEVQKVVEESHGQPNLT